jgi:dienelactone hydrolase
VRPYEVGLLVVAALAVIWPALFGVRSRRGIAFLVLCGALAAQLAIEGYRWQLLPLLITAAAMAVGDLFSQDRVLPWWRRASRPLLGLVGLAMMAAPLVALPVPRLPPTGGPLSVGTTSVELVFPDRMEPYGPQPDTVPRRIMAQVWYPAEPAHEEATTWNPDLDVVGPALARRLGFPSFFFDHTRYVTAHSVQGGAPLEGTFPVVIYSHGWGGFRTVALNQVETLASSGYVVIAPDHTYAAVVTRFPDGEVVELDPNALPEESSVDPETYARAAQKLTRNLADDLVGIMDALAEGSDGPFGAVAVHADVGRIGLYGHSTGGGAAVWACLGDERCKAVLGMDPWVEPVPDRQMADPAGSPMLFMRSDQWRGNDNDGRLRGLAERSETVTYWLGIEGAGHSDFVVTPLFSPIADRLGLKGPIPTDRVVPIIDRFLVGFFDVFLTGTGPAALNDASYPEVSLEIIDNRS